MSRPTYQLRLFYRLYSYPVEETNSIINRSKHCSVVSLGTHTQLSTSEVNCVFVITLVRIQFTYKYTINFGG